MSTSITRYVRRLLQRLVVAVAGLSSAAVSLLDLDYFILFTTNVTPFRPQHPQTC